MKKILFSFINFLLFSLTMYAQHPIDNILPKVSPLTPEQTSFARFGNYTVDLFHGLPDITIPLYEIKSGSLSLPISLSYHASGIKVNDWGSWIGIGWSLNAGASITRRVMGLPDEQPNNYLSGGTVRDASNINKSAQSDLDYLQNINRGLIDGEPDIFCYNIPGMNGKFLFNQPDNLKPILIPFAPIKINKVSDAEFKISSENGTIYDFGTIESTNVKTTSTSAWLLSQISSANQQDKINFTYNSRWGTVGDDYQDYVIDDQEPINYDLFHYSSTYTTYPQTSDINVFCNEQKINEITFNNGKVRFNTSATDRADGYPGQKALSSIEVLSLDPATNTYTLIKKINFYQSYFTSGTSNIGSYDKRLKLDKIEISDKNGNVIEKYQFDYNTDISMPDKLSRARDFWGYYNGKNNNTLVPQLTVPFVDGPNQSTHVIGSNIANSRDPDATKMQACVLKRITYPTGGYTDFFYETNQYKDENNQIKYAGGLRIKTIKSYPEINSNPLIKTYTYGVGELGYGRANFFNPLYFLGVAQGYRYVDYYHNASGGAIPGCLFTVSTKSRVTYYSTPTVDIEPYDGSPVVYPTVTEYMGDLQNNIGKTVYEFTDHADDIYSNAPTQMCYRPIVTTYHMDRGQLLHKVIFKRNSNGSYSQVHETQNTYQDFGEKVFSKVGIVVFKSLISEGPNTSDGTFAIDDPCGNTDANSYRYTNYDIRSTYNRLTQTIETSYDQSDQNKKLITTTNYSYENPAHMFPTKTITTNSKKEIITSQKKYTADFSTQPYATMTGLNILDGVVQETQLNGTTQISLVTKNYQDQGNNNYLPSNIDYQLGSNNVETRAKFNSYDISGNILDMQKSNDTHISYQWDNFYPVAEVINASNSLQSQTILVDIPGKNGGQIIGTGSGSNFHGAVTTTPFTVTRTGDVVFYLSYSNGSPVDGSYTCSIDNVGRVYTLNQSFPCGSNIIKTYSNVPPGTYTMNITANSTNQFGLCYDISYPSQQSQIQTVGIKEFYYEGFEDLPTASMNNAIGKRGLEGDFTVPFAKPNNREYVIDYHYRNNGKWFSITKTFTNNMTLTEGVGIDEVRVYPIDAQMTTYTYAPLIGVTSKCDINNKITYYEYDGLGRLSVVRDQDKNILKTYCYNYFGQPVNCKSVYTNKTQSSTLAKNDCTDPDYSGSEVTYSIEEGNYTSENSQEEADSLAIDNLNANRQSYANLNGTCLPLLNFILDNYEHIAGFTINLTSVYDSTKIYTIVIPEDADSSLSLQKIPQGHYNIDITKPDNTVSYVFTVSGPFGDIQINSAQANWVNVPVNTNTFNKISIGIQQ
jgi:YD repeat-containing protein